MIKHALQIAGQEVAFWMECRTLTESPSVKQSIRQAVEVLVNKPFNLIRTPKYQLVLTGLLGAFSADDKGSLPEAWRQYIKFRGSKAILCAPVAVLKKMWRVTYAQRKTALAFLQMKKLIVTKRTPFKKGNGFASSVSISINVKAMKELFDKAEALKRKNTEENRDSLSRSLTRSIVSTEALLADAASLAVDAVPSASEMEQTSPPAAAPGLPILIRQDEIEIAKLLKESGFFPATMWNRDMEKKLRRRARNFITANRMTVERVKLYLKARRDPCSLPDAGTDPLELSGDLAAFLDYWPRINRFMTRCLRHDAPDMAAMVLKQTTPAALDARFVSMIEDHEDTWKCDTQLPADRSLHHGDLNAFVQALTGAIIYDEDAFKLALWLRYTNRDTPEFLAPLRDRIAAHFDECPEVYIYAKELGYEVDAWVGEQKKPFSERFGLLVAQLRYALGLKAVSIRDGTWADAVTDYRLPEALC